MDQKQTLLCEFVNQGRDLIAAAEKTIWENPELGFEEWKTHAYMKAEFEKMGYTVVEFGNIPGFYADVDTGKPGPKVLLTAEMDALLQPTHKHSVDGKDIQILHLHASIEANVLIGQIPDMDAVGIQPTAVDYHTPNETLFIDQVQPFWDLLLAVLAQKE